jgi:transcription elongation GreA/GreB family factor
MENVYDIDLEGLPPQLVEYIALTFINNNLTSYYLDNKEATLSLRNIKAKAASDFVKALKGEVAKADEDSSLNKIENFITESAENEVYKYNLENLKLFLKENLPEKEVNSEEIADWFTEKIDWSEFSEEFQNKIEKFPKADPAVIFAEMVKRNFDTYDKGVFTYEDIGSGALSYKQTPLSEEDITNNTDREFQEGQMEDVMNVVNNDNELLVSGHKMSVMNSEGKVTQWNKLTEFEQESNMAYYKTKKGGFNLADAMKLMIKSVNPEYKVKDIDNNVKKLYQKNHKTPLQENKWLTNFMGIVNASGQEFSSRAWFSRIYDIFESQKEKGEDTKNLTEDKIKEVFGNINVVVSSKKGMEDVSTKVADALKINRSEAVKIDDNGIVYLILGAKPNVSYEADIKDLMIRLYGARLLNKQGIYVKDGLGETQFVQTVISEALSAYLDGELDVKTDKIDTTIEDATETAKDKKVTRKRRIVSMVREPISEQQIDEVADYIVKYAIESRALTKENYAERNENHIAISREYATEEEIAELDKIEAKAEKVWQPGSPEMMSLYSKTKDLTSALLDLGFSIKTTEAFLASIISTEPAFYKSVEDGNWMEDLDRKIKFLTENKEYVLEEMKERVRERKIERVNNEAASIADDLVMDARSTPEGIFWMEEEFAVELEENPEALKEEIESSVYEKIEMDASYHSPLSWSYNSAAVESLKDIISEYECGIAALVEKINTEISSFKDSIEKKTSDGMKYYILEKGEDSEEVVKLFSAFSCKGWCTRSPFMAKNYIKQYTNIILTNLEGKTVAGIEADIKDGKLMKIYDITPVANNHIAPLEYIDQLTEILSKYEYKDTGEKVTKENLLEGYNLQWREITEEDSSDTYEDYVRETAIDILKKRYSEKSKEYLNPSLTYMRPMVKQIQFVDVEDTDGLLDNIEKAAQKKMPKPTESVKDKMMRTTKFSTPGVAFMVDFHTDQNTTEEDMRNEIEFWERWEGGEVEDTTEAIQQAPEPFEIKKFTSEELVEMLKAAKEDYDTYESGFQKAIAWEIPLGEGLPEIITRDFVKLTGQEWNNVYFLFGDNLQQKGLGGQAKEMRGEPNTIGIPTKKKPSMSEDSFFTDKEFSENKKAIDDAFSKIPKGSVVIIPKSGLGTGLAKLESKAPKTFAYLNAKLQETQEKAQGSKLQAPKPVETKIVTNKGDYDVLGMRVGKKNINTATKEDYGKKDSGWLGNPYVANDTVGGKGKVTRAEAIELFRKDFNKKIESDPDFKKAVEGLRGKTLGYYKPELANHLDVVVEYLYPGKTKAPEIKFETSQATGYADRTRKNASADATIALAADFNTRGEIVTKEHVISQGKKYIPVQIDVKNLDASDSIADSIVKELNEANAKTLNIAGNGIYSLGDATQEQIDTYVYNLLKKVTESPNIKNKITSIRSGGQTGFDEAGIKAANKLGISSLVLATKDWKFRNKEGVDISNEAQFKARFGVTSINKEVDYKGLAARRNAARSEEFWEDYSSGSKVSKEGTNIKGDVTVISSDNTNIDASLLKSGLEERYNNLLEERKKNIEALKTARSYGDLSENAEYEAARDRQSELANEISKISNLLRFSGKYVINDLEVQLGSKVEVRLKSGKTASFVVGLETDIEKGTIAMQRLLGESKSARAENFWTAHLTKHPNFWAKRDASANLADYISDEVHRVWEKNVEKLSKMIPVVKKTKTDEGIWNIKPIDVKKIEESVDKKAKKESVIDQAFEVARAIVLQNDLVHPDKKMLNVFSTLDAVARKMLDTKKWAATDIERFDDLKSIANQLRSTDFQAVLSKLQSEGLVGQNEVDNLNSWADKISDYLADLKLELNKDVVNNDRREYFRNNLMEIVNDFAVITESKKELINAVANLRANHGFDITAYSINGEKHLTDLKMLKYFARPIYYLKKMGMPENIVKKLEDAIIDNRLRRNDINVQYNKITKTLSKFGEVDAVAPELSRIYEIADDVKRITALDTFLKGRPDWVNEKIELLSMFDLIESEMDKIYKENFNYMQTVFPHLTENQIKEKMGYRKRYLTHASLPSATNRQVAIERMLKNIYNESKTPEEVLNRMLYGRTDGATKALPIHLAYAYAAEVSNRFTSFNPFTNIHKQMLTYFQYKGDTRSLLGLEVFKRYINNLVGIPSQEQLALRSLTVGLQQKLLKSEKIRKIIGREISITKPNGTVEKSWELKPWAQWVEDNKIIESAITGGKSMAYRMVLTGNIALSTLDVVVGTMKTPGMLTGKTGTERYSATFKAIGKILAQLTGAGYVLDRWAGTNIGTFSDIKAELVEMGVSTESMVDFMSQQTGEEVKRGNFTGKLLAIADICQTFSETYKRGLAYHAAQYAGFDKKTAARKAANTMFTFGLEQQPLGVQKNPVLSMWYMFAGYGIQEGNQFAEWLGTGNKNLVQFRKDLQEGKTFEEAIKKWAASPDQELFYFLVNALFMMLAFSVDREKGVDLEKGYKRTMNLVTGGVTTLATKKLWYAGKYLLTGRTDEFWKKAGELAFPPAPARIVSLIANIGSDGFFGGIKKNVGSLAISKGAGLLTQIISGQDKIIVYDSSGKEVEVLDRAQAIDRIFWNTQSWERLEQEDLWTQLENGRTQYDKLKREVDNIFRQSISKYGEITEDANDRAWKKIEKHNIRWVPIVELAFDEWHESSDLRLAQRVESQRTGIIVDSKDVGAWKKDLWKVVETIEERNRK